MRLLALTLLALGLPLLAACGGSSPSPPTRTDGAAPAAVPSGFKGYTGTGFSIAYPTGWAPADAQADAHRLVELRPPGEEATRPLIGVALEHTGERTTLEAYAATFSVTQTMDIPGWRAVSEQAVDVPGAMEGRLIHAAYKLPGSDTQVRELVLFARLPGGRVYVVRAGGEASAFARDEHQLRTAVDSFRPAKRGDERVRRLSAEPGFLRGALCAGAAQIVLSAIGAGVVAVLVSRSSVGPDDADGVAIALGGLSMFVTAALSGAFGASQAATLGAPTRRVARLAGTTGAGAVAALLALASLSALPAPGMALVDVAFGVGGAAFGAALLARRLHEVA